MWVRACSFANFPSSRFVAIDVLTKLFAPGTKVWSVKYAKGREIGRLNSDKFIRRNYETLASSEKTGIVRSGSAFP